MTGPPAGGFNPTAPSQLRAALRARGFRPRKSLGQTFLVDENIVRKVVAAARISPEDRVLEIGPGAGAVTRGLLSQGAQVVAVEVDPTLTALLQEMFGDGLEVICEDVLRAPLPEILARPPAPGKSALWKVVTNLPYSITGPAVVRLLEMRGWISEMVVMVQYEVAERLLARPGSRLRGWLGAYVELCCEARLVARVSRHCFWPEPGVDSAILGLVVRRPPFVSAEREEQAREVMRRAFAARRKTMLNALCQKSTWGLPREQAAAILQRAGIAAERRAESLSLEDFLRLAEALAEGGAN